MPVFLRHLYVQNFVLSKAVEAPAERRNEKLRILKNKFFYCVVVPTIASLFYYVFVAQHWHVAEAKFIVQRPEQKTSSFLDNFLGSGLSSSSKDALMVREYILSPQAMIELNHRTRFFDIFTSNQVRFINRTEQG